MNKKGKNYDIAFDPKAKTGLISILGHSLEGLKERISERKFDFLKEGQEEALNMNIDSKPRDTRRVKSKSPENEWSHECNAPDSFDKEMLLAAAKEKKPRKIRLSAHSALDLIYHDVEFSEMKDATEIVEGKEIPIIEARCDDIPCPIIIESWKGSGWKMED